MPERFVLSYNDERGFVRIPFEREASFEIRYTHFENEAARIVFSDVFYEATIYRENQTLTLSVGKPEYGFLLEELPEMTGGKAPLPRPPFDDDLSREGLSPALVDVLTDWLLEHGDPRGQFAVAALQKDRKAMFTLLAKHWAQWCGPLSMRDSLFTRSDWLGCFLRHVVLEQPTLKWDIEHLSSAPIARFLETIQIGDILTANRDGSPVIWNFPQSVTRLLLSASIFPSNLPTIRHLWTQGPIQSWATVDYDPYFDTQTTDPTVNLPDLETLLFSHQSRFPFDRSPVIAPKLKRVGGWINGAFLKTNSSVEEIGLVLNPMDGSLSRHGLFDHWLSSLSCRLPHLKLITIDASRTGTFETPEWRTLQTHALELQSLHPRATVELRSSDRGVTELVDSLARRWGFTRR